MEEKLSVPVARRLDGWIDAEVRNMLRILGLGCDYNEPSPLLLDPDYDMSQLPALARRMGVSLEVLSKYRLLCDYIDIWAQGSIDPNRPLSPEELAADLGISFEVFEPYKDSRVARVRADLEGQGELDDDSIVAPGDLSAAFAGSSHVAPGDLSAAFLRLPR